MKKIILHPPKMLGMEEMLHILGGVEEMKSFDCCCEGGLNSPSGLKLIYGVSAATRSAAEGIVSSTYCKHYSSVSCIDSIGLPPPLHISI